LDVTGMFVNLTYPLGPATPTYGDNPPVEVRSCAQIENGDVANWLEVRTINHNGTHLDAPYHFNPRGKRITDLAIEELVFDAPTLLEVPKMDGELVTAADLRPAHASLQEADILLVRTGWAAEFRSADPERYGRRAPGFAISAGTYLLHETAVRAVAMDIPSAASPVAGNPNDEGLEFHRIVLRQGSPPDDRYVLLIEDVCLDTLSAVVTPTRIIAAPLWLADADAAPVPLLSELPSR
jgi:kynurenine formamidase